MPSTAEKERRKKLILELKEPNTCHCKWEDTKVGEYLRTEERVQKNWDPYCAIGTTWHTRICRCAVCGKERPELLIAMA